MGTTVVYRIALDDGRAQLSGYSPTYNMGGYGSSDSTVLPGEQLVFVRPAYGDPAVFVALAHSTAHPGVVAMFHGSYGPPGG